jgi:hypothetical protein
VIQFPVVIRDLCGPVCVSPSNGGKICWEVGCYLSEGHAVLLDFTGVEILTPAFLNAAVSCLHGQYSADELLQRVSWRGLDPSDAALLELVCQNANRFYHSTAVEQGSIVDASSRLLATCQ